jgi:hypothetical protein
MKVKDKRVVVLADPHCGHRVGLTPPKYQSGNREQMNRLSERWKWFKSTINKLKPFGCAVWLGDLCDGLGKDTSECILPDLNRQIRGAIEIVETVGAKTNFFVYGTAFHVRTKDGLELETEVAKHFNAEIHGQIQVKVDDYILDCRHSAGSKSGIKTSRGLPIAKERESNIAWWMEGCQELATHYFRAHVHYLYEAGEPNRWQGYAVPALQDHGTKYGRVLSNTVHMGFGVLTIKDGEWPIWKIHEAPRKKMVPFKL